MIKNIRKKAFFIALSLNMLACASLANLNAYAVDNETVAIEDAGYLGNGVITTKRNKPITYSEENTPWDFGQASVYTENDLNISGTVVESISRDKISDMATKLAEHKSPIILDLSNSNITEIRPSALMLAPIQVLKLPASINKIGAGAFKYGLIHQIYFKNDPNEIEIGDDAFSEAVPNQVGPFAGYNIQTIPKAEAGTEENLNLPIGPDFLFYYLMENEDGNIVNQENPYFIDVNGKKTYATLKSNGRIFETDDQGRDIQNNPIIALNLVELTPFTLNGTVNISTPSPVKYNLTFQSKGGKAVELKGSHYVPYNRVMYFDTSMIQAAGDNPGETVYMPKAMLAFEGKIPWNQAIAGESTGLTSNLQSNILTNMGLQIVSLKDIYPELTDEKEKEIIKSMQERFLDYETYNTGLSKYLVSHLNKKYMDISFVAKRVTLTYNYYDINTGKQISSTIYDTFSGAKLPNFDVPKGFEAVMENFKPFQRVASSQVILIPVRNVADKSIVNTINFVNEDGIAVGPTFFISGKPGSPINLEGNKTISDFIKKYSIKFNEVFNENFAENGHYVINVKGKVSNYVKSPSIINIGSGSSASQTSNINRLSGENRVETSVDVSGNSFEKSEYVFLASGNEFPDALTGGVLASLYKAPMLLSNEPIESSVLNEINRLGAKKVIIIGGYDTLSKEYEKILSQNIKNVNIERIKGVDRYGTSVEVANRIRKKYPNSKSAIIASGESYPDALTSSVLAAKLEATLYLSKKEGPTKLVRDNIKANAMKEIIIAGGKNSVEDVAIDNVLKKRISGEDRYQTAVKLAEYTYPYAKSGYLCSGENFADALSVVPVASKNKKPILLSSRFAASKYLKDYAKKEGITDFIVVGGSKSISDKAYYDIFK